MALTSVEVDALKAFFASKRGRRELRAALQAKMVKFFEDRLTTVRELITSRPPTATEVEDWKDEWKDAAQAAGVDALDVSNVVRAITGERLSDMKECSTQHTGFRATSPDKVLDNCYCYYIQGSQ